MPKNWNDNMATWEGNTIDSGRYAVLRKLASGGFGDVFLAFDTKLEQQVVLKIPRASWLEESDFAKRYRREIRAMVRLRHPNIVGVLDVGDHQGHPFAVFEYLAGGTLADQISRRRREDPLTRLRTWLPSIASALDYVHQKGYVHRDVKPENIIFDAAGHPFLGDFGVAKSIGDFHENRDQSLTATGLAVGTPDYMAPEVILGMPLDGRADQYSLAVMVYEFLTERCPFSGDSAAAVMIAHTQTKPVDLTNMSAQIPWAVADAVGRALAKNPLERFANCRAFWAAMMDPQSDEESAVDCPVTRTDIDAETAAAVPVSSFCAEPSQPNQSRDLWPPSVPLVQSRPVGMQRHSQNAPPIADCSPDWRVQVNAHEDTPQSPLAWLHSHTRELSSTYISALLHASLLVILALIAISSPSAVSTIYLDTSVIGEPQIAEELVVDFGGLPTADETESVFSPGSTFAEGPGERLPAELGLGTLPTYNDSKEFFVKGPLAGLPSSEMLYSAVAPKRVERPKLAVQDDDPPSNIAPANVVDKIASEIAERLASDDLLVIWLFDSSISMTGDRAQAAERLAHILPRIYAECTTSKHRFRQSAFQFGDTLISLHEPHKLGSSTLYTRSTGTKIIDILKRIRPDQTGRENVFQSLLSVLSIFRDRWAGQTMVVVWTDESGDDVHLLEDAIKHCRERKTSVTVVGPSAVLGRQIGSQHFYNRPTNEHWYLPVLRGPDAGVPQIVQVPHWHADASVNSLLSGFGCYAYVRLARETGGRSWIYDRGGDRGLLFHASRLAAYEPDYRATEEILTEIERHPLRKAVVEAASLRIPQPNPPWKSPWMGGSYPYGLDTIWKPASEYQRWVRTMLRQEYVFVSTSLAQIEQAIRILDREEVSRHFATERSQRWRANYDLALGRLLKCSVRHREYLKWCELMQVNLHPQTTKLTITTGTRLITMKDSAQRVALANRHLQRCVSEHAGTPSSHQFNRSAPMSSIGSCYGAGFRQRYQQIVIVHPPPRCSAARVVFPMAAPRSRTSLVLEMAGSGMTPFDVVINFATCNEATQAASVALWKMAPVKTPSRTRRLAYMLPASAL